MRAPRSVNVIIGDGASGCHGGDQFCAREGDVNGFVGFNCGIAVNGNGHGCRGLTDSEGEGARNGVKIVAICCAGGRSYIINRRGCQRRRVQRNGIGQGLGARIAFGN